jgi:hypothetical protein
MNVSATGGAGQSGTQAAKYIPGMAYGEGQATMAQQKAAPMAASPATPTPSSVTPLDLLAPTTRPNEPVTAGAAMGAGPGPEALNLPSTAGGQADPDLEMVRRYFPVLEYWANQPDTSQATKDYVQYLRGII